MNFFGRKNSTKAAAPAAQEPAKFTLPYLKNMHKKLVQNKEVTTENMPQVIEILRVIAEMVVYGDAKSELLFDFFCEANMLSLFLEIMRSPSTCPMQVLIQILQTLSILCQSVRNTTSMYYLLSNNYINEIIGYSYDFEDDELVDTFISFMKSLSLRLNTQTVQFFFIEETGAYPLLSKAITFLSFKEPMVRTAAQATILNVYRIDEVRAREYALQERIVDDFLSTVTSVLNTQYASMCDACFGYRMAQPDAVQAAQLAELTPQKMHAIPNIQGSAVNYERQLDGAIIGFEDWMYYLQDIMDLKIPRLTRALIVRLVENFVQMTLLSPIDRCGLQEQMDLRESVSTRSEADAFPHNLTQASLSLFIICQMFRVITCQELHRAVMVAMLHPMNTTARKCRIRNLLTAKSRSGKVTLSEKLVKLGLSNLEKKVERSDVRMSIEGDHPALLKIREEQIAGVSNRLRSSSTSSTSLSRMLNNEVSATRSQPGSPTPEIPRSISDISVPDIGVESAPHETNASRKGFEIFFTNEKFSLSQLQLSGESSVSTAEISSISCMTEGARCSLLACLMLQSVCSSMLALTERSRYDDNSDRTAEDEQLTSSAFFIYSHLFQSMALWPVLSSGGELYPPSKAYYETPPAPVRPLATEASVEPVPESDNPTDLLEFASGEVGDSVVQVETATDGLVGVKLDMNENGRVSGGVAPSENPRTKPCDFDVALELVFSATDACPNPFTSEPGVSIGAGKRLSMDGAALRPGEDADSMPTGFQQEFLTCANDDLPALVEKFAGVDWVDPNIVPVPLLDAMFEQQQNKNKWSLDYDPSSIPVLLSALMATDRAANSLPVMQLCLSSLCQYCWMTRRAYCSTGATKSGDIAIKYIYDVCADQATHKSKKLVEFANGEYADEFLSIFENEVERAIAMSARPQSWSSKIQNICKDAVFLLLRSPTTDYSHYSQQISTAGVTMSVEDKYDMLRRIDILEDMRRSIQIFLLLRSATKRLKLILNRGSDFSIHDPLDMQGNADDLFCLMVDEFVRLLGPETQCGDPPLHEGSTVVMKRRQCVAAFIIRTSVMPGTPSGTNSPAPGTRTSIFSRTFAAPPVTPPAAGGISSLYTAPITRTPERNRKTGDVYFIIDDTSVLIASPDKSRLDEGLVRICFPVYNAVALIDKNDPRDLRILVQSTTPIAGMNEVSCNAFPSTSAPTSPFKDLRSNFAVSPISGANVSPLGGGVAAHRMKKETNKDPFSPPLVSISTWEVSVGFESAKNCEIVAQHITASRIRVRSLRLDNIRAFLTYWGDKENFI